MRIEAANAERRKRRREINGAGMVAHSDAAARLLARRVQGYRLSWRETAFLYLQEPQALRTCGSTLVHAIVWLNIILFAAKVLLESNRSITANVGPALFCALHIGLNAAFTVEAAVRAATYIPSKRALSDPLIWLDLLTCVPFWIRLLVAPSTLTPSEYLTRGGDPGSSILRVLEALASLRVIKLARYYEGAGLMLRAVTNATAQLLVPMFFLVTMTFCFATLLYELEYDPLIERCRTAWEAEGLSRTFLDAHPPGVTWDCSLCVSGGDADGLYLSSSPPPPASAVPPTADDHSADVCASCRGFPIDHPECLGTRWQQNYHNVFIAIWFFIVTVTPAGVDVFPVTFLGKLFVTFVTSPSHTPSGRISVCTPCSVHR